MDLKIGNSNMGASNQLKARYVASAGGLAIFATALIAAGPWHHGSARPAVAAPVASSAGYTRAVQPPRTLIYLAGSKGDAAVLESAISSDAATLDPAGQAANLSVFVVDSPEKEFLAAEASRERMQSGLSFQMVDLR